ncbi:MAG TPA: M6 family metalloprotease domain-containing protein [Candidatus Limnocylindria bacterium]|nr:M6 family metalloprotease domain-containing protein [Candidatus Limnocylindria bacterium]
MAAACLAVPWTATRGLAIQTTGALPVLVVLAQFPDRPLTRPRSDFTGAPGALVDRFVAYWAEVSSGRLRLDAHVASPVVTLPEARASYVQRPFAMARDALRALAAAADPADRAALARGGALVVFFAGVGRESDPRQGDPDDPWSNYTGLTPPELGFSEAIVVAEREEARDEDGTVTELSPFGVLCHEFGHLLGLPELYAPSARTHEGIGVWGLMGQGTWVGRGDAPPHPEAWSKAELGWVDVETITESRRGVVLPPVEREPRIVRIPAGTVPQEYYLLEYRRRIGADARLPGEGILVWHVDERRRSFRHAQAEPARKLLHLVEADGRGDLDRGHAHGGNRGDAGDPWTGPSRLRRVVPALLVALGALAVAGAIFRLARAPAVVPVLLRVLVAAALVGAGLALRPRLSACGPRHPGMAPYDGSPGRVVIGNFSPLGEVMRFDVSVGPPAPAALVPRPDAG